MKLKFFFCQFPNPWALRVSGMGGYTSKCEKKSKSLHPRVHPYHPLTLKTFAKVFTHSTLPSCSSRTLILLTLVLLSSSLPYSFPPSSFSSSYTPLPQCGFFCSQFSPSLPALHSVAKFIVPDWRIQLTPAKGCRTGLPAYVARRRQPYMPESIFFPPVRDYEFG